MQRVETQKGHRRALGGVNLLARGTPGRRIEVQASVGATLRPTVLVGFRDLRSRSAYRVFSLTAVWSRPSVSSKQSEITSARAMRGVNPLPLPPENNNFVVGMCVPAALRPE